MDEKSAKIPATKKRRKYRCVQCKSKIGIAFRDTCTCTGCKKTFCHQHLDWSVYGHNCECKELFQQRNKEMLANKLVCVKSDSFASMERL